MNDPMIWVRALHFAATILAAGASLFRVFVAEPAFREADNNAGLAALVRSQLAWIVWVSLVMVFISGTAWLVLQAQRMSDLSLAAVLSEGTVWTVLTQTGFGQAWVARFVLLVLFIGVLLLSGFKKQMKSGLAGAAGLVGGGLVGALAWAGHAAAGSDSDIEGTLHLTADILHLLAAAAWVGALVPLAILLAAAWRIGDGFSVAVACQATLRFSTLGIVSVGTLVATGLVNSWVLAGSVHALFDTDYGRLLLLKIALFLIMLSIAAINRLYLTPRLVQDIDIDATRNALRQLRNNSLIEATLGAIILVIVGILGTLPPGVHEQDSE